MKHMAHGPLTYNEFEKSDLKEGLFNALKFLDCSYQIILWKLKG